MSKWFNTNKNRPNPYESPAKVKINFVEGDSPKVDSEMAEQQAGETAQQFEQQQEDRGYEGLRNVDDIEVVEEDTEGEWSDATNRTPGGKRRKRVRTAQHPDQGAATQRPLTPRVEILGEQQKADEETELQITRNENAALRLEMEQMRRQMEMLMRKSEVSPVKKRRVEQRQAASDSDNKRRRDGTKIPAPTTQSRNAASRSDSASVYAAFPESSSNSSDDSDEGKQSRRDRRRKMSRSQRDRSDSYGWKDEEKERQQAKVLTRLSKARGDRPKFTGKPNESFRNFIYDFKNWIDVFHLQDVGDHNLKGQFHVSVEGEAKDRVRHIGTASPEFKSLPVEEYYEALLRIFEPICDRRLRVSEFQARKQARDEETTVYLYDKKRLFDQAYISEEGRPVWADALDMMVQGVADPDLRHYLTFELSSLNFDLIAGI